MAISTPAAVSLVSDKCDGSSTQNQFKVTASHGKVFYIDSGQGNNIDAAYAGYKINALADKEDVWVRIDNFTGGVVTLANPADANMPIGDIANGGSDMAYFLLKAPRSSSLAQSHRVSVYLGRPDLTGNSPVYTCTYSFVKVAETIKASPNKVTDISASTTSLMLGGNLVVTVEGQTGQIGQGSSTDGTIMWITPAARSSWPTAALRLVHTQLVFYTNQSRNTAENNATFINQLYVKTLTDNTTSIQGNNYYYTATYTFRVVGKTPANTDPAIIPVAQISSGTQIKHTNILANNFPSATVNTDSVAINASLTKAVSSTVTYASNKVGLDYTITLRNSSTAAGGINFDQVVDTHSANLTYVANSVRLNGGAYPEPQYDSSGRLIFGREISLGAAANVNTPATATLTYSLIQVAACNANDPFTYQNNAVGRIGSLSIGSNAYQYTVVTAGGTCSNNNLTTNTATQTTIPIEVTTLPATNVTNTDADLFGLVDPNGTSGSAVSFELSTNSNMSGAQTFNLANTTNSNDPYGISKTDLTGLNPGTTYYFRAKAGTVYGEILSFTTTEPVASPTASTLAPTGITLNAGTYSVTFNGSIDPNQTSTDARFRYQEVTNQDGTCVNFTGNSTDVVVYDLLDTGAEDTNTPLSLIGSFPTDVVKNVTGLTANKYYCYRVMTAWSGGSTMGGWVSFKTATVSPQTITFPQPNDMNSGAVQNLSASTDATNRTVTYTTNTPDICSIIAGPPIQVSAVDGGTCSITASHPGDLEYYPAESVTVTFTITAVRTLTYDGNGSTGGTVPNSQTGTLGSTVTVSANSGTLVKSNFTFAGWNSNAQGTGTDYSATNPFGSVTLNANTTIYAKWTATITYADPGNTKTSGNLPASQTLVAGNINLQGNTGSLAKTNHTLLGWNTQQDGSGTTYALSSQYNLTGDVTLYPIWQNDGVWLLDYNGKGNTGGSVPTTAQVDKVQNTTNVATPANTFLKAGRTFDGWYTTSNYSGGTKYAVGAPITVTANTTLYAIWQATVTYDLNGGTGTAVNSQTGNEGASVQTPNSDATLANFNFDGWNTLANGQGTDYAVGANLTLSSNITLYAKWSPITFTITYSIQGSDNGTAPANTTGNGNVQLRPNSGNLAKNNSTFRGWNSQPNCAGTDYAASGNFNLVANVTLYPCFDAIVNNPQPAAKQKAAVVWKNPNAIVYTTELTKQELNAVGTIPTVVTERIADPAAPEKLPDSAPKLTGKYVYVAIDPKSIVENPGNSSGVPAGVNTGGLPTIGETTVLAPGSHKLKVIFVPDDPNYEPAETIVEIQVKKLRPPLTWVDPAPIVEGTPLSNKELNANSTVPGRYEYVQTPGQLLPNGNQLLKVRFIPDDLNKYEVVETEVELLVKKPITPRPTPIVTTADKKEEKPIVDVSPAAKLEVKEVGRGLTNVVLNPGLQVQVTPSLTFSGKTTVLVTVEEDGQKVDVLVPVTVLPLQPQAPVNRPTAPGRSTVTWQASPNAIKYDVIVDGEKLCETSATSCQVQAFVGPKTKVEIVAKGNDETVAAPLPSAYRRPASPVLAAVKNFATNSFELRPSIKRELREFAKEVRAAGFTRLQVQGHTDIRGGVDNSVLSRNRAQETIRFLKRLLPEVEFKIGYFASARPAADNSTREGLAANRRVEISLW